jgi:hypothetical protein
MKLRQIFEAPQKVAVTAFGRMNPPTIGHDKLVNKITAIDGDHYLFLSQTQKPKDNPLPFDVKLEFAKKFFPGVNVGHPTVRTPIQMLQMLEKLGYTDIVYVAGSDRVEQFEKLFNDYNGKEYNFNSIRVVSAGERDPDADGAEGMSASKMRAAAAAGDFDSFAQGVPSPALAQKLYDAVRTGMGIKDTVPSEAVAERVRDPEDWDEGNTEPPNNFAVYINGKKWKVFKGRGQFADDYKEIQHYRQLQNWAQAKSQATGKKWTVSITGEPATESVAEGYQLDEGAIETITALAKKIPGIGKYYQLAQQYKPQLIDILKTSKSGKEVKQKMEQLASGQSATVAESGMMKQLGGLAVGGGSILSTMWMNAMGMIDGVLAHAAAGEVGGAVASGSILGLIPVTLMLFAAMLLFKGSKQSSDEKAQAFQAQRGQQGVAEGSRTPQDWEVKSAVWGLDKRGVHQEPQDVKSHFVRADRRSRAEEKAKREYEPGRQTWSIHPRGNKEQGVAEGGEYNKFKVGQRATYKNSRGQEFPVIVTAVDFDEDAVEIRSADNKPFPNSGGDLKIVVDPGWKFLTPEPSVDPNSIIAVSPSMRKTTEASYEGNIGIMELFKFFGKAEKEDPKLVARVKEMIKQRRDREVWRIIQDYTGTQLTGKEFEGSIKEAIFREAGHGKYWCSTDKKWKYRKGPKQTRSS